VSVRAYLPCRSLTSLAAATLFAISEINAAGGIDGRPLLPIHVDPQSHPQRYRELATALIVDHKVQVIFGCYLSSSRKAVVPVVEKWNRLLFYPTLYEGFEYSANVIYTGAAPNQNSVPLANYMLQHFGSRVSLIGSDYIYPYESNRIMSDLVLQHPGGKKLSERYLKLGASRQDFAKAIQEIRHLAPDFIFSTVVGADTALLYQAYAEAGLDPLRMPIASLTTSETEIAQMGAVVAAGRRLIFSRSTTNKIAPACNVSSHRIGHRSNPTCVGKPPIFKCICLLTHYVHRAMMRLNVCGLICLEPNSMPRKGG